MNQIEHMNAVLGYKFKEIEKLKEANAAMVKALQEARSQLVWLNDRNPCGTTDVTIRIINDALKQGDN